MSGKRAKRKASKIRRQIAALPWREGETGIEVLVMTSRGTRRPVIPKGWPMKGLSDRKAAGVEAREEAGLVGRVARRPIGRYDYWKRGDEAFQLVRVSVYPMRVEGRLDDWKERGQRAEAWMPPEHAAELDLEPGLSTILLRFAGVKGCPFP